MIVLVCGGRDYNDREHVFAELDRLHAQKPIKTIIEGGAKGADLLAQQWARHRCVNSETFHAEWQKHGRAAGPMRNSEMLRVGKPDLVLAFPGGRGADDMVRRARASGVRVVSVSG